METAPPTCPEGHGPMERAPGFFTLPSVERQPSDPPQFNVGKHGLIIKLWVCTLCGRIEMRADDRED